MATTTFSTMIPTPTKNAVAKRPGPPVPPRPHQSSLYKTQRDSTAASTTTVQRSISKVGLEQPQNIKKPSLMQTTSTVTTPLSNNDVSGGRTIIYKSPSMNLPKRHEDREKRSDTQTQIAKANAVTQTASKIATGTYAPKPPLKLRKAPDIPISKPPSTVTKTETPSNVNNDNNNNNKNNVLVMQHAHGVVALNRHHSMNTPSQSKVSAALKETRLSLGRADFGRVDKVQLNQLQPTSQPLPRPRKIVKIPVATLDVEDSSSILTATTTSSTHTSLFKRSKTTLDNFTSRSHITTVGTGNAGSYFSGKTVEIKNNLKNAAERLFSEIMVNQQKHNVTDSTAVITKHERAIQHQTLKETSDCSPIQASTLLQNSVTVVSTNNNSNCTRINITATSSSPPISPHRNDTTSQKQPTHMLQHNVGAPRQVVSAFNSPEKKSAAFHEMLISELAAMRTRSCSMENLQTKSHQQNHMPFNAKESLTPFKAPETKPINKHQEKYSKQNEDIDADNIEDADDDEPEHDNDKSDREANNVSKKHMKVLTSSSQTNSRKRTPSGCSSDSSPYGTERSSRIRTSDWIEVGDNGKQVTLTSCHISLEDSGMEDEERMDEMSSSGVGDSWDSVKEAEQQQHAQLHQQQQTKRNRSVKRVMSINDLPPLPKSLSGINKMLGSDSGVLSDVDTEIAKNAKNMEIQHMENQNENTNSLNTNVNNNYSSNNTGNVVKKIQARLTSSSRSASATNSYSPTSASEGVGASNTTSTMTTTTSTTPLKEINGNETISEIPPAIPGSKLDNQIATLRKEMFGLRQLDLSLLSQLWALNDSIQEFRTMIQENEQEDDETYSTHTRSPSPYDSVSSDADDEISALKSKKLFDSENSNVITTQPKLNKIAQTPYQSHTEIGNFSTSKLPISTEDVATTHMEQKSQLIKPPLPKPLDVKPLPRMRSAPPPPPTHRKSQNAPSRPT